MSLSEQLSAISMLEFESYLEKMDSPDLFVQLLEEKRNPLNESFENRSEEKEMFKPFLAQFARLKLVKIQRYVFNTMLLQKIVFFQKKEKNDFKLPVSLALLYRLENIGTKKVIIVYKTEDKGRKYLARMEDLTPGVSKNAYFASASSMIINDKRAIQKSFKLMAFTMSRFLNLLNQKNLDFAGIDLVLFIEIDQIVEHSMKDFESFINLYNQRKTITNLNFINCGQREPCTSVISDAFGSLFSIDNQPQ